MLLVAHVRVKSPRPKAAVVGIAVDAPVSASWIRFCCVRPCLLLALAMVVAEPCRAGTLVCDALSVDSLLAVGVSAWERMGVLVRGHGERPRHATGLNLQVH